MDNTVSFTKIIKDELCQLDVTKDVATSILNAFTRASGEIGFKNKSSFVSLETENANTAKYIFKLLKTYHKEVEVHFSFCKAMHFHKATKYIINIDTNADEFLKSIYFDLLETKIDKNLINTEEKIKGYLIGLFLASGSCNNPASSNYHLEISVKNEEFSLAILKMIKKIKSLNLAFKEIKRRNEYVIYLKRSDQISDFLAFIDANNSCLEFENVRVDRDYINVTNRMMNCDSYNCKKSLDKAVSLIDDIDLVDKKVGLSRLNSEKLTILCRLRKQYVEASYQDLADKLSEEIGVKVSKSNVNHLFIKIKQIAEELRRQNEQ